MSEHEPTEYHLDPADRELIAAVDFRLNNILTYMLPKLEALRNTPTDPEMLSRLDQFKQFLFDRVTAIYTAEPKMQASKNPDMLKLGTAMQTVAEQLMAIAGAIVSFQNKPDVAAAKWVHTTTDDAYHRMHGAIEAVGLNPAYRAYKAYIKANDLEAGRTTFNFNPTES